MNQMEGKRKRYTIISNMILLLNLLVLSMLLGEHGIGYLAGAFECFFLFLLLTVYSMPEAIAKLIRVRMQKGQGKNALRVFKTAVFIGIIYCVLGSIFFGFGADILLNTLLGTSYGAFTLRLFIPAYVLYVFVQIFRGYFQGMGSAVPTGVSKIIEKIILFGTGILFCAMMKGYGEKVSALLVNVEFTSSYASAGMAIGFCLAELFAILFLIFVYETNKRNLRGGNKENFRMKEHFGEIMHIMVATMLPTVLCGFLGRVPILGGMALYQHTTGLDISVGIGVCGAFYGKYLTIVLLFIMLIKLSLISLEGQIQNAYRKDEYKYGRERLSWGVHYIMILGSFFTVLLTVLGKTLMEALFAGDSGPAGNMFVCGSTIVLFMALSLFFIELLIGQGRIKLVFLNLLLGVVVFFLYAGISTKVAHAGFDGIVVGLCISWFVITCGCGFVCVKTLRWNVEWVYLFAIPVGCAALSGIIMMLLNKVFVSIVGEGLSVLICLIVGFFLYYILLMALRGIHREEFEIIPGGRLWRKFAEIINLL